MESRRVSWLAPAAGGAAGAVAGGVAGRVLSSRTGTETPKTDDPTSDHPKSDDPKPDDLDKELLDQLHAATLKASDSCFEIKKLCAVVLVPTGTLVSVFADKKLDASVFAAGLLVVISFWLADSVGYFYQRKLRNVMTDIWERRALRCHEKWVPPAKVKVSVLSAAINGSMIFYLLLAVPILVGFLLLFTGVIASPQHTSP